MNTVAIPSWYQDFALTVLAVRRSRNAWLSRRMHEAHGYLRALLLVGVIDDSAYNRLVTVLDDACVRAQTEAES